MELREYDIGSRNVHHHPLMKSTTIDVPGSSIGFIDSGNVGMHDDGFHLDPSTQFEYSMDHTDNSEETTVITKQTVDMVIEAGLKANLPFPKIKEFIECLGSCSPVSNGTDKEGNKRKPVKLEPSKDYQEYPDDKGVDRFKDSIIEKGLELGLSFPDIKNILEVADSGNPSINHNYPYESKRHVDANAIIKTPWPQAHIGHDTEPQPGAEQEFRSPTEGSDGYVKDPHDPGKGHTPQIEAVIGKGLQMGLTYPEIKKVLEDLRSKDDTSFGAGANVDRNEEKDTDHSPEAAEDDAKKGKNTQMGEATGIQRQNLRLKKKAGKKDCPYCRGTGRKGGRFCDRCDGTGAWYGGEKPSLSSHQDDISEATNTQIGEKTEKVKGGYENIGKKKNGSKKHGVMSKKKADAQRGAMFAHRKPGASWGK